MNEPQTEQTTLLTNRKLPIYFTEQQLFKRRFPSLGRFLHGSTDTLGANHLLNSIFLNRPPQCNNCKQLTYNQYLISILFAVFSYYIFSMWIIGK